MTEIHYKHHPTYEPKLGRSIQAVEISENNIFITDANNRVYQVWLDWSDDLPVLIQIIRP